MAGLRNALGEYRSSGRARSGFLLPAERAATVASMHEYAYSISGGGIWVNLYGSNSLNTKLPGGQTVRLEQESNYPWDGKIRLTVGKGSAADFAIRLRIPGWSQGATVAVNGKQADVAATAGKYVELKRQWSPGDHVELDLPLKVQLIESNPLVEETRNHVAVMRGPLVYCLESPDLPPGVRMSEVAIPAGIQLTPRFDENLLGGLTVLEGEARRIAGPDWTNALYRMWQPSRGTDLAIRLIPYYAWANRGISYMTVWMPRIM